MPRSSSLLVVAAFCLSVVLGFPGCESLARTQGRFPAMIVAGEGALKGKTSEPERGPLLLPGSLAEPNGTPLIRFGYRNPWTGKLVNAPVQKTDESQGKGARNHDPSSATSSQRGGGLFGLDEWDGEGLYIVIDVGPALRDPSLGSGSSTGANPSGSPGTYSYNQRLVAIAETLVIAADYNGETYWRHLAAFLKTYEASKAATTAATGAGAAAAFIAPPLSASLTGGALLVDAFVGEYTSGLEINNYAALREATSIYRKALRHQILKTAREASAEDGGLTEVLALAHEYAFSYSIQGTIAASQRQTAELKTFLDGQVSDWSDAFGGKSGDKGGAERTEGNGDPVATDGSAQ